MSEEKPIEPSSQAECELFTSHFSTSERVRALLSLTFKPKQYKWFNSKTMEFKLNPLTDEPESGLKGRCSDLLVTMKLYASRTAVHILIEHEKDVTKNVMFGLLRYMLGLYAYENIGAVLAVVFYHKELRWAREKSHQNLIKGFSQETKQHLGQFTPNYKPIYLNLREDDIIKRMEKTPWRDRLVLWTLARNWEKGEKELNSYLALLRRLGDDTEEDLELAKRLNLYFESTQSKMADFIYDGISDDKNQEFTELLSNEITKLKERVAN